MNPYYKDQSFSFAHETPGLESLEFEQDGDCEPVLVLNGFARGDHQLTPGDSESLHQFLKKFIQQPPGPGTDLRVVGHADDGGDPEANRALGLRRALQVRSLVKAVLRENNVSLAVKVQGGEDDEPRPSDESAANAGENRRVELLLCPAVQGVSAAAAPVQGVYYRPYRVWWHRRFPSWRWWRTRRVPPWSRGSWMRRPVRRPWRPTARVRRWSRARLRPRTRWPVRRTRPSFSSRLQAPGYRPVRRLARPLRRETAYEAMAIHDMPLEMPVHEALEQENELSDLEAWPEEAEVEFESTSQCDCRSIKMPSKGNFSKPLKDGHAWYTPKWGDYGEKLARCVAIKNNTAEGRLVSPSNDDVRAVWSEIKNHQCNKERLAGRWFLPRFRSDRCRPGGPYYGAIYIPFNISDGHGRIVDGSYCS